MRKQCAVDDCKTMAIARGYCDKHYRRVLHNGTLETRSGIGTIKECTVPYCDRDHKGHGLCAYHFVVLKSTGTPFRPQKHDLCGWKDCFNHTSSKGLCRKHYAEWQYVLSSSGLGAKSVYSGFMVGNGNSSQ